MNKNRFTKFQIKVWLATAQIPLGQTRSYKWLAEQMGNPKAIRAVGQALKKNPFAPLIPCHRVIKEDGSLGGYSAVGGCKQKERLLKIEKSIARYWGR